MSYSDYSFYTLDMDKISLLTPVLITHNWKSTTTEIVLYLKAVDHIVKDSKLQIFLPTGFTVASNKCLFDTYLQPVTSQVLTCTASSSTGYGKLIEVTNFKTISKNTQFRIIMTDVSTPTSPVVSSSFKIAVEESFTERVVTPVTYKKVSLLNDVFYHAVITDTPSNNMKCR